MPPLWNQPIGGIPTAQGAAHGGPKAPLRDRNYYLFLMIPGSGRLGLPLVDLLLPTHQRSSGHLKNFY